MAPRTRYAKSGEIHIAYQVVGQGPLDLVYVPGWVSHVELAWEEPTLARFLNRLSSFARLIMFDKRGTGLSDRVPEDKLPTLEERMNDLVAVMDAVGSERAAVFGVSEGGNLCALFAATYPDRTAALVTFGAFAKRTWSPDYPWAPTHEQREEEYRFVEREWGNRMDLSHYVPSKIGDEAFASRLATYLRRAASPGAAVALLRMNTQVDIRAVLPTIRVPALVIHRTGDRDVRVEEGRWLAERIPQARFVELPGEDHFPWVGDQDAILDEVQEFLTGVRPAPEADRLLTTLLFTDMVGSTELAARLGDRAWKELLEQHHSVVRKELDRFRGHEVDAAGDGFFLRFDAPAQAILCACSIRDGQRRLGIEIRAGLHTGEVELSGGRLRGIAVHIAARVSAAAQPGEVLVSNTVKDLTAGSGIRFTERGAHKLKGVPGEWRLFTAVRERLPGAFEDPGEHHAKNVARPVHAFRLSAEPEHGGSKGLPGQEPARKPSVAVLPFDNLSGDPSQDYFADGITEDIITALSKNRWLSVIARNSTFALKGRLRDVRRVAAELGAGYVVEGSVRKSGDRLRIAAQLIDGASGNHIWAERYDRDLADIFAVQDEVTGTIAARIEPELGALERRRAERKPTQSLDAWDCYHLGLSRMYRFDREGNREAQRLFRRAIAFDPQFAAAHARLAYCVVLEMVYFDAAPSREVLDEALSIAQKSVGFDDRDAFCHLAVARVHLARREYEEAVAACRTSLKLNPTFAQAHCAMGDALSYAGRGEEAIREFEESIRLSPQDPWRWAFLSYQALARIFLRQHEKAVESARTALRIPNCQYWANAHLVAALGHLGRKDEGRDAISELLRRKPGFDCRYAEEHLFYLESREQVEHYLEGLRKAGVAA
jgi:TolB-like protein/pimeloyl-ACP methyl ester carboxylesterase/lipoprotein NlpI